MPSQVPPSLKPSQIALRPILAQQWALWNMRERLGAGSATKPFCCGVRIGRGTSAPDLFSLSIFEVTNGDDNGMENKAKQQRLTVDQTDEIIRTASPANGAIEDCTELATAVLYHFETGSVGRVDRMTGLVSITAEA
jgi:hypothetical protein